MDIIGHSGNPSHALSEILQLHPDIVFLDIAMPVMNGIELASHLLNEKCQVVFVTAFNDYALQAFKLSASGYLLKPIDSKELTEVVDKCRNTLGGSRYQLETLLSNFESMKNGNSLKLAIPTKLGLSFISIDSVIRMEAEGKYTKVITRDAIMISSKNIGYFEEIFLNLDLIQVHKSHIVNIHCVLSMNHDSELMMSNGDVVPLGRRRKKGFLKKFIGS